MHIFRPQKASTEFQCWLFLFSNVSISKLNPPPFYIGCRYRPLVRILIFYCPAICVSASKYAQLLMRLEPSTADLICISSPDYLERAYARRRGKIPIIVIFILNPCQSQVCGNRTLRNHLK